ncbi:MAG TPA: acetate--CoA ligase family protein, partial [Solirubrobacterales bacterium]|nr:acetate--CoA ligase family protein [Solirubrobacterales bacterium]
KSDNGAVVLGLASSDAIRAAAGAVAARAVRGADPDADTAVAARPALLVERMAPPGVELVVAARADGLVPTLVLGLGGIWTEALDDVAILPLPAAAGRIERALRSLRGAALLTGGRGREPIDLGAVSVAASRAGEVLLAEDLELVELNPLIAGPDGCTAVDAVARRRR